jgi:tellurite resistance protein TehA-like permease
MDIKLRNRTSQINNDRPAEKLNTSRVLLIALVTMIAGFLLGTLFIQTGDYTINLHSLYANCGFTVAAIVSGVIALRAHASIKNAEAGKANVVAPFVFVGFAIFAILCLAGPGFTPKYQHETNLTWMVSFYAAVCFGFGKVKFPLRVHRGSEDPATTKAPAAAS